MKIGAIVQARMGSTRLPGKVLKKIKGKTILEHVINRLKFSTKLDKIIVATTTNPSDDLIVDLCKKKEILFFRGSEDNVLERYFETATYHNLDVVVRVTSDCPLIDANILDKTIVKHLENTFAITTNAGLDQNNRTFPRGLDTEVFNFQYLKDSYDNATKKYQKEHVTPYIYEKHANKIGIFNSDIDYSYHRWTLDTPKDFKLIEIIYEELYTTKNNFMFEEILKLFEIKPEILDINKSVTQKKIR